MIKTIVIEPAQIKQILDSLLLTNPAPEFRHSTKTLWKIYQFIKSDLMPKVKNDQKRLEKLLNLEKQFLELYEQALAKEEELKTKTNHCTQEPFYSIRFSNRRDERIFSRFKIRSLGSKKIYF